MNPQYRTFKAEVLNRLSPTVAADKQVLTKDDTKHLPEPVKRYIDYVGALGKPKVHNFRAAFEGTIRLDPDKGWANASATQYNFYGDELTRLFYMRVSMMGLPVYGLHSYTKNEARMLIKVAGLVPVVDSKGPEMRISDTTTLFNDLCLFAPAALIDDRITWDVLDSLVVRATFSNAGTEIKANLYFNEQGELVNFISNDRYRGPLKDKSYQKAPWSTPVSNYQEHGGYKLPSYTEVVWNLPEGDFCYLKLHTKRVEYNLESFE